MAELPICARCGTPLDGFGRQCPRCLFAIALDADASTDETECGGAWPGLDGADDDGVISSQLSPGQLFGPYRIERLLGKGGMGEVYEAVHLGHERRLAIKILTERLADREDRERFLREGQLAASVNHPNSVYVFGSEEIAGTPVISMELMPGGTLKDRVQATGPMGVEPAVDRILQVVAGLEAVAAAGIHHRDIKPSNCFVDVDGTVKIGDFGLSISALARAPSLTVNGCILATPAFASPEQLTGRALDVRSDIYAVGATLYYLLTGQSPFDGGNIVEAISRVVGEPHRPVRDIRREVPRGLARAVDKCLAKRPEERYADYAALRTALTPFSGGGVKAAPLGLRFAASLVDAALVAGLFGLVMLADVVLSRQAVLEPFGFGRLKQTALLVGISWWVYFGLTEGLTGASPGKLLCGLRVVRGGRRPEFWRMSMRVALWWLIVQSWQHLVSVPLPPVWLTIGGSTGGRIGFPLIAQMVLSTTGAILLFVPARRANGLAGLHDLLSGTRVVVAPTLHANERIQARAVGEPSSIATEHVGPYAVVDAAGSNFQAGWDARLKRFVWIARPPHGLRPADTVRRGVARPLRVRWLNSGRDAHGLWEAYDAPPGQPWSTADPRPWRIVSGWIAALAAEFQAGSRDGTLPPLTTGRLWIDAANQIRLLDWEIDAGRPSAAAGDGSADVVQDPSALLSAVASQSVEARSGTPLGLAASAFVRRLDSWKAPDLGQLADEAADVARRPDSVTPEARARHLAVELAMPLTVLASAGVLILSRTAPVLYAATDQRVLLPTLAVMDILESQEKDAAHDEQLRLLGIRAHELLHGPLERSRRWVRIGDSLTRSDYARLERAAEAPAPSSADIQRARDLSDGVMRFRGEHVDVLRLILFARIVAQPGQQRFDEASFRVGCAALIEDFGSMLRDGTFWESQASIPLRAARKRIAQCVDAPPALSSEDRAILAQLRSTVERARFNNSLTRLTLLSSMREMSGPLYHALSLTCAIGFLSAVLFRGGLVLSRLGFALVTADGSLASHARIVVRSLVAWTPGIAIVLAGWLSIRGPHFAVVVALAFVGLAAGIIAAVRAPARGWQDRIAGTYLVPE